MKKREEKLSDTDRLEILESVYRSSVVAIFIVDVREDGEFIFQDLNPAHEALSGMTSAWIRGKTVSELSPFIPEPETKAIRARYQQCVDAGTTISYEEMIPMGGKQTWWLTKLVPLSSHGRINRIIGMATYINELKEAQLALEETRKRLNTELKSASTDLLVQTERLEIVARASDIGIWDWDLTTGTVYFSERWKTMLGYNDEELPDSFETWEKLIHPDDRDAASAYVREVLSAPKPTFDFTARFRRHDGTYAWIRSRGAASLRIDGTVGRLTGAHTDITQEKEAQNDRENQSISTLKILDRFPGVVYVVDPETWKILYINTKAELVFDRKMEGTICYESLQGRDSPCPFCTTPLIRGTREPHEWEFHNPVVNKDYFITDQMIEWYDGREVRIEYAIDISRRKQMEQRLEQSNRDLENFAYVASHDLQEPLRKIRAFGDRLKRATEGTLNETALDSLNRMTAAANRMQKLIDDVLALSRINSRPGAFEHVRLKRIIGKILITFELTIREAGATVETGPLPEINGDPNQLEQLFGNLIGNALKFHDPQRSPVIRITGSRNDDAATISIADNGIGIDDEYREKIFGVFQRLHGRNAYPVTGIGLSICRRVAERHKATISVSPNEPHGTIFTVSFPAAGAAL